MPAVALQIDSLGNALFSEYVMAPAYSFGEPQIPEQAAQVIKADIRIRATTENSVK